jgi:biotin carboxylase
VKPPTLLLVGAGIMGRPYIRAARRLGCRIVLIEGAARAGDIRDEVDKLCVTSSELEEAWTATALAAVRDQVPDGVLAFAEPQVIAAALVRERLGLPGPSLNAAVVSRNKALQRAVFASHGIPQPEHRLVSNLADAADWASSRYPVIVKPLNQSGSRGVSAVHCASEFAALSAQAAGPRLVEVIEHGPEYSWEALLCDGRIVFDNLTAKETTGSPQYVETRHLAAAQVPAHQESRVRDICHRVTSALMVSAGLVHLEFRLTDNGPRVMEVAVRTPGDYIMDMLSLTYGCDFFEAVIRVAMSGEVEPWTAGPQAYAGVWFPVASPGRLRAVAGLDQVRGHPDVAAAEIWYQPGDVVPPLASSRDRAGYVLVSASTTAERDSALAFARDCLRIETETEVQS